MPRVLRTDPDGRATHKEIRTHWDPGDQVPFDCQVKFDQATHASTVVRIVIDFPSDYGPTGNDAEMPSTEFEILLRIAKPSGRIVECFEGRFRSANNTTPSGPIRIKKLRRF